MKLFKRKRGFVPIIVLILAAAALVGGVTVTKLPEKLQEFKQKAESRQLVQANLPEGSAVADEILVGFRPGVPRAQIDNIHQRIRARAKKNIERVNTDVVELPEGVSVPEAIALYKTMPEVEYAEPNFLASAFISPNDPLYSSQWNLKKVLAEDAYDVSKGGFGLVAIVDTGVDSSHPDLSGLVVEGYNTIDENNNSGDDHGHGTHVAGIASAQTDNSTGIASISYQAKVLPVKVLNKDGFGTYADVSEGIVYSADQGSRIINLSLGGSSDSETLKRAVNYALGKGSLLVAAAGNNGNDSSVYPASYKGVLAVSASDQNDNLASFSTYGNNVFVASPGVSITSSIPGGNYKQYSGTSMSAPHLAGLIAIALSAKPELSNSEVIDQIKNNAEKVGQYTYDQNGWNPYFGYGRISSGKTLTSLSPSSPSPSPSPTTTTSTTDSSRLPQQAMVPKQYQFSFELQATVEGADLTNSKVTLKVEGGTPNVLKTISGNLVDVYADSGTRIKYQGKDIPLSEITAESKVNVKGNVVSNRLLALEILVQFKQSFPVDKGNPAQQPSVPALPNQSNQQPESPQQGNPSQDLIPSQGQQRGRGR
ncbi:MAG: S8 family serine peptidase [Candidatus Curtissbacteria bacterium]